jgi:heavy metal response regulator
MVRVLVVEDEARIAAFIRQGLQEEQYVVDVAEDGEAGLLYAEAADYDLILLDVLLPRRDGFAMCADLRRKGISTPVLMLTARDSVDDRVRGLDAGADDYLVKPFAFKELLARMRALLRRPPETHPVEVRAADLTLDMITHQAMRAGQVIELTAREYRLLEFLLRHRGQPLTRLQIADAVWGFDSDAQSNVVDVYIRYLRRKVDDPFPLKLIHTVRGVGYKLEAGDV